MPLDNGDALPDFEFTGRGKVVVEFIGLRFTMVKSLIGRVAQIERGATATARKRDTRRNLRNKI